MNALILAAGFCTRLYPITEYFPKGLLPVRGKPIIQTVLDQVIQQKEIKSIAVATNSRYEHIINSWIFAHYGDRIRLVSDGCTEPNNRLGAIGDILFSIKALSWDDDVLILPSDTLTSLSVSELMDFYTAHHGVVSAVYRVSDKSHIAGKLGCAVVDGTTLVEFIEKPKDPPTDLASIPMYIFPKETLGLIDAYKQSGGSLDAPGSILSWLIGKVPVFVKTIGSEGFYYDIGTVEQYNKIQVVGSR